MPWLKNDLDGGIDNTGSSESSEGLARLTRQHHFVLSSVGASTATAVRSCCIFICQGSCGATMLRVHGEK